MPHRRSLLLLLPLAACASDPPPPRIAIEPLRYDYLPPLRLDVASLAIEDRIAPPNPPRIDGSLPVPPRNALRAMGEDRLRPVGLAGDARYVLVEGSMISQRPQGSSGLSSLFTTEVVERVTVRLAARLEIEREGRTGSIEARVERGRSIDEEEAFTVRQALLHELLRQAMADMNVEFEFQLRRNLRDFLLDPDQSPSPRGDGPVRVEPIAPPVGAATPAARPPSGTAPPPADLGTLRLPRG